MKTKIIPTVALLSIMLITMLGCGTNSLTDALNTAIGKTDENPVAKAQATLVGTEDAGAENAAATCDFPSVKEKKGPLTIGLEDEKATAVLTEIKSIRERIKSKKQAICPKGEAWKAEIQSEREKIAGQTDLSCEEKRSNFKAVRDTLRDKITAQREEHKKCKEANLEALAPLKALGKALRASCSPLKGIKGYGNKGKHGNMKGHNDHNGRGAGHKGMGKGHARLGGKGRGHRGHQFSGKEHGLSAEMKSKLIETLNSEACKTAIEKTQAALK